MIAIRPEQPSDVEAIRELLRASFPTGDEAELVDRLRDRGNLRVSIVAEDDGRIVGHVAFSPVTVDRDDDDPFPGLGLAPLAAIEGARGRGIGAVRLVEAGIEACRSGGIGFVVVLGKPHYYRRFGFATASGFGLGNVYGVDEPFLAIGLRAGGTPPSGVARFGAEFDGLG